MYVYEFVVISHLWLPYYLCLAISSLLIYNKDLGLSSLLVYNKEFDWFLLLVCEKTL